MSRPPPLARYSAAVVASVVLALLLHPSAYGPATALKILAAPVTN